MKDWYTSFVFPGCSERLRRKLPKQRKSAARKYLFDKQNGRCYWCSKLTRLPTKDECNLVSDVATIDHKIPKSKGGTHGIDNLVMACYKCNNDRGSKDITEFLLTLGASNSSLANTLKR